jgi:hypothetical protein
MNMDEFEALMAESESEDAPPLYVGSLSDRAKSEVMSAAKSISSTSSARSSSSLGAGVGSALYEQQIYEQPLYGQYPAESRSRSQSTASIPEAVITVEEAAQTIAANTGDSPVAIQAALTYLLSRGFGTNILTTGVVVRTMSQVWPSISAMLSGIQNPTAARVIAEGSRYFGMVANPIGKALPALTIAVGALELLQMVYKAVNGQPAGEKKEADKQILDKATATVLRNETIPAFKGGSGNQNAIDSAYLAQAQGNVQRATRTQYKVHGNRNSAVVRPLLSNVQIMI